LLQDHTSRVSARSARRRALLNCRATRGGWRDGDDPPGSPPQPPLLDADSFDDFGLGGDGARAWRALEAETRTVITLAAGFFLVPALVSVSLRAAVIDPTLYFLQADFQECSLTPRQWNELTLSVEAVERRLRYDARMGHAARLSEPELEEKLKEVGLRLEEEERLKCREAVGNSLSDGLGTVLLFAGFWLNRGRLRVLRQGIASRFLSLEASTQAFVLLMLADVTVRCCRLCAMRAPSEQRRFSGWLPQLGRMGDCGRDLRLALHRGWSRGGRQRHPLVCGGRASRAGRVVQVLVLQAAALDFARNTDHPERD